MSDAPRDRVLRAVTEDGSFRVVTLRTRDLATEAIRRQGVSGHAARLFGELLTGAVMVRETMSPAHRVQVILSGAASASIVADAKPSGGATRGLVALPEADPRFRLGPGALLKVIRTLPRGQIHQSVIEADPAGVSESLMAYMQSSEQVFTTASVSCVIREGEVIAAGGYLVQLLPECSAAPLAIMAERLADAAFLQKVLLESDADPERLMDEVLYGFPYERLSDEPVSFRCDCSEDRVLAAVMTLGKEEIAAIVARREVVDLTCEYCQTQWSVGPDRFANLLMAN